MYHRQLFPEQREVRLRCDGAAVALNRRFGVAFGHSQARALPVPPHTERRRRRCARIERALHLCQHFAGASQITAQQQTVLSTTKASYMT